MNTDTQTGTPNRVVAWSSLAPLFLTVYPCLSVFICGYFSRVVEEAVQRGVAPSGAVLVGQALEAAQVLFADPAAGFLVGGVAVVDTAAQGARLAGGAEVARLERAEVRRGRPLIGRGRGQQDVGLQAADEEGVAVLLEAAAA